MQDNVLGALVEGERYRSEPGTRRDYHLLTGGIIANEVDITTCHVMSRDVTPCDGRWCGGWTPGAAPWARSSATT